MPKLRAMTQGRTIAYTNPVWPHYFADPFVLRVAHGEYYAYGTAPAAEEGCEDADATVRIQRRRKP